MQRIRKRAFSLGMAVVAIACCAVWPIVAGLVGGAAVGSVWGEGAFALVMMATVAAVVWRVRRARSCAGDVEVAQQTSVMR